MSPAKKPTASENEAAPTIRLEPVASLPVEDVERLDLEHIRTVIRRWGVLIGAGVIFIVGVTALLLQLSPQAYLASTNLEFDQPRLIAGGDQGMATTNKLVNLMPTYASVIKSDQVLAKVQKALQTRTSTLTLRNRLTVAPVERTLQVSITAHDKDPQVAISLVNATVKATQEYFTEVQTAGQVPPELRYQITPLQRPSSYRASRNEARTLILAAAIGFVIMVGIAFVLEYIDRS